ncbi:sugar ABC transporter substrate-binding protein [Pseudooceanicola sp. CBS1P-1]|uniref:Extracellular solute-binding protein n=1 Tax=Pseudooceanicola albus TaxID=2692189 RepID=A0A6L7G6B9_9RHOB|nr:MULTISPECIES: sugar ABC transporter substrate-binding protein [Pseudooceanicola]MBT9385924.1 sugar ABC transporter substrate-binding protein [Pseudooceanicola endophyticus]MXN19655.1 extracellular solute-binding protein [Pseudooceanicola albus]
MKRLSSLRCLALASASVAALAAPALADQSLKGVTLTLASQNDQFAAVLAEMAPEFEAATGAKLKVDILDYGSLLTKTTADFVGQTGSYDLVTMDIVWAGQYAENGYTVDLTDWIARDKDEIDTDDIYPVLMQALGQYDGKQVAFPFAGYANVLAYRKDLLEKAGLGVPTTPEEFTAAALKMTDPAAGVYGFVANGQKGAAGAQDWMQYNAQMGGAIMGPDGKPDLNSDANIHSLQVYKELFDKAAPPGAANYDWGGREESFRQGIAAMMQTWSVGAPGYYDPASSKVVDTVGIALAPSENTEEPSYGVGGWGIAINAGISEKQKEAAWEYIKWMTSKPVHKEMILKGSGSFLRKSEMADPELKAKFPFLPILEKTFENGDGSYRPRIPEYPEIQDLLGTAVNAVLVGDEDPKAALDAAQKEALDLF